MILGSFWRSEPAAELRGLAKIWPPDAFLPLVQFEKGVLGHVNLAAHLADFRHVPALELLRHVLERADIGGDVFALGAVATRGSGYQLAALVAQRHRQAVDLRLGAERDLLALVELQETPDAGNEVDNVLIRECIVERQHRQRVPDLLELAAGRGADLQ